MKRKKQKEAQKKSKPAASPVRLWWGLSGLGFIIVVLGAWFAFQFTTASVFREINASEAHRLIRDQRSDSNFIVLDVRTPEEFAQGYLPEKTPLNLNFYAADFREQLAQLDREKTYLVYCRTGNRSSQTVELMKELGFRRVYDLQGGIVAWQSADLPIKIEK